ncbi:diacylglycerol kinase [Alteromonas mediterranea]|uniref:Diacylglycerol kinase n=2 Tax=Alteromonas TaxID=226 RepID=F2G4S2_ALTMD|nr:diacylglycerol kinase [Alteromonas mediterranea]AEA96515.1 diacylglycerol kinase [Alteromonas mediterranea DE]CAH1219049.1 Diacylglycerol kinase [Alteromonas mediterranea]
MRVIDEATSKMHFDPKAKPKGMLRIVLAMKNSVRAISSWLVKNESAFRQELILLILAAGVLAFWSIPYMEKAILLSSILFVLFAEIINTAIEVTIDRIGKEIHPLSGLAKDLGSAAVLVTIAISSLLWLATLCRYF